MPRVVTGKIQSHVGIYGLKNIVNGSVPWLPDGRIKCAPFLSHGSNPSPFQTLLERSHLFLDRR